MTDSHSAAILYAHENAVRFLEELKDFTAIASISTEESSKADVLRAADWITQHMRSLGINNVEIYQTPWAPCGIWRVVGSWKSSTNCIDLRAL